MIKNGLFVTIIFIFNVLIGFVSQIIITRIFGAKLDLEIFLAATTVPTLLVTVIYATLNDVFLPLYGEKKAKNPNDADSYFLSNVFFITLFSFIFIWIFSFFSTPISYLLFSSKGWLFVITVSKQMTFMMYSIPLAIAATLFGSYFYTHKMFIRFPIAQAIGSVINLVIIILLVQKLGVWALVLAFIFSILFQILLIIPKNISRVKIIPINIIPVIVAWFPLIIGSIALRSDALLIRSFAADLPQGYFVYLNIVYKLFSLATGVMTIGIQVILLPHLVDYFVNNNYKKAFTTVNKAKKLALAISLIVILALMLVLPFLINAIFIGGKFSDRDATLTISLLPFFILPSIGWGINSVFFQPLIALKKVRQLGLLNVSALIIAWTLGSFFKARFNPLLGITIGLTVLLFTGIIGSEILWQYYKKKLQT